VIISLIATSLFLLPSSFRYTSTFYQINIKFKNILSLNVSNDVYNANTSEFLGSKNISSTPYRITETHHFDKGILNNVVNVTSNQTFLNTYLMI